MFLPGRSATLAVLAAFAAYFFAVLMESGEAATLAAFAFAGRRLIAGAVGTAALTAAVAFATTVARRRRRLLGGRRRGGRSGVLRRLRTIFAIAGGGGRLFVGAGQVVARGRREHRGTNESESKSHDLSPKQGGLKSSVTVDEKSTGHTERNHNQNECQDLANVEQVHLSVLR